MFRESRENRSDQDASAVRTSRDNHLPTLAHPAQRCGEFGKPAESALSKKRRNRRAKYLPRGGAPASVRFQGFGFGTFGAQFCESATTRRGRASSRRMRRSSTVILFSPRGTRSMTNSQNTRRRRPPRAGRGDSQNPKPCLLKVTSRPASVPESAPMIGQTMILPMVLYRMVLGGNA